MSPPKDHISLKCGMVISIMYDIKTPMLVWVWCGVVGKNMLWCSLLVAYIGWQEIWTRENMWQGTIAQSYWAYTMGTIVLELSTTNFSCSRIVTHFWWPSKTSCCHYHAFIFLLSFMCLSHFLPFSALNRNASVKCNTFIECLSDIYKKMKKGGQICVFR
jgi:hypothetical protein